MVTCRTHARCSQINSLIGSCASCDRVSVCRVGSANGIHFGFQLATRSRKPTLKNGYTWVMIPQVTSESSAWLIFLRWYRVLNTKIVPPNINDLKKHFRHRDRHGKQVENMIGPPWKLSGTQGTASFWERTEAPLPPQRPWCNFIPPHQLSPFPERLKLPLSSEEILSGYEDVVSSGTDQVTTWVKTDPDVNLVDMWSMFKRPSQNFARRHDTCSHVYHLGQNNYSFDALQAYCFGINIKL